MAKRGGKPPTISAQLKAAIEASGLTTYALGNASGVDSSAIQRFLSGERSLKLESVDKLAAALGLQLTDQGGQPK
jgi:transcriptional regulator with XRE-family HTH domain